MNSGKFFETCMGMSDHVWKKHTNPWSAWTRLSVLPLIALVAWSREWVSGETVILFGFFVALWIWINPRLFTEPKSTNNWMSKGVMGERAWINQKDVPIPDHFNKIIRLLNGFSAVATVLFIYGLVVLDLKLTLLGMVLVMLLKLWFIDRMVWLYEDMSKLHTPYAEWMKTGED